MVCVRRRKGRLVDETKPEGVGRPAYIKSVRKLILCSKAERTGTIANPKCWVSEIKASSPPPKGLPDEIRILIKKYSTNEEKMEVKSG